PVARDLSRDGIRVVTIMPGLFLTPMFAGLSEEAQRSLAASVPFPSRLGHPDEDAALAVHICENPMVHGEVLRLDGSLPLPPRSAAQPACQVAFRQNWQTSRIKTGRLRRTLATARRSADVPRPLGALAHAVARCRGKSTVGAGGDRPRGARAIFQ